MPNIGARAHASEAEAPAKKPRKRRSATPSQSPATTASPATLRKKASPIPGDADTARPEAGAEAPWRDEAKDEMRDGAGRRGKRSAWNPFRVRPGVVNVKLIYAAYLASLALPLVAILGAVFAHQARRAHPAAWLETHYTYQVRTFWIGFAANIVASVLALVGIGLLLYPLIAVWVVARSVKGLINVAQRLEIEDPYGFFI
ncbi:hypothetical protein L1787_12725 [Acuticoccus sp. M5D2P5]|uniref:DUF4870 family protein n=1 Tax=Acuticoccus kalidii TaxID=2910977 RepID=UPI001F200FD3|nr:hypothetical protein [Acuticoccus kalidii]MCF3934273.1 hypothetical protein [Acuticoccus kalidii]